MTSKLAGGCAGANRLTLVAALCILVGLLVVWTVGPVRSLSHRPSRLVSTKAAKDAALAEGPFLVYVLLGDPHFQHYALHSMRQARLLNPTLRIVMVVSEDVYTKRPEWVPQLHAIGVNMVNYTMLMSDFVWSFQRAYSGLWGQLRSQVGFMLPTVNDQMNFAFTQLTMERLYALHQVMHVYGLKDVIHVENDQMLYTDVGSIVDAARNCGVRLAMTKIGKRMAPAVVYAADSHSLRDMLEFIYDAIAHGADHAKAVAGTGWVTDMSLTAAYFEKHRKAAETDGASGSSSSSSSPPSGASNEQQRPSLSSSSIISFPNRPEPPSRSEGSCVYKESGGVIFDAASLGHWCCGTFERPKDYYVHRDAESEVPYWDKPFEWTNVSIRDRSRGIAGLSDAADGGSSSSSSSKGGVGAGSASANRRHGMRTGKHRDDREQHTAQPVSWRVPRWDGHPVFNLHIHSKQLHLWGSEGETVADHVRDKAAAASAASKSGTGAGGK